MSMEQEAFYTGYCRQLDASRMVEVEYEDGQPPQADCGYGSCPYESQCTIAQQIRQQT